jgi:hypothetical protein
MEPASSARIMSAVWRKIITSFVMSSHILQGTYKSFDSLYVRKQQRMVEFIWSTLRILNI